MNEIKSAFKESSAYLFTKNPVLVLGLVIGQLAAGVSNLQNAAALSVTYFFVVSGVLVFASLFGKKLPGWLKVVLYAIVGSLMLVPSYFISAGISATIFDSVGIYPALLAVSTVPIVYSEKIAENKKPLSALVNGICIAFGFPITAFILGAAREILGSGSLFGFKVVKPVFPAAKLPFWGFIFLGFMAALVNFIKEFIKKPTGEEETE
jgi:Na+-translocating ferredoxin:NAD+ oxidoreductase RnfE subunit